MFSATFPAHVESLAKRVLTKPVEIVCGERDMTNCNITQFVEVVEDDEKTTRLCELLDDWYGADGSILVFVERKTEADTLFASLVQEGFE
jgi:ATP-dependent RNA helicase DDX46/PRP5